MDLILLAHAVFWSLLAGVAVQVLYRATQKHFMRWWIWLGLVLVYIGIYGLSVQVWHHSELFAGCMLGASAVTGLGLRLIQED